MNCLHCNKETSNPKFCSKTCSVSYSNKNGPAKRKRTNKCKTCDSLIRSCVTYCTACWELNRAPDETLKEAMYTGKHLSRSSLYAKVRARARSLCKNREQKCIKCGYSKHVEVAHVIAINTFSEDTLLSKINEPSNLVLLCPNCHWKYDKMADPERLELPIED